MKRNFCIGILALSFTQVHAQSPALPETYSFSANANMGGPMTVKVNRNGSKELIEMRLESGAMHTRQLYDFQAHRVYNLDLNVNQCTTQEYTSSYAPTLQDPIGGSAEMARQTASLPVVGTETVNGIATKVVETALSQGRGKYKSWLDQKHGFPVKQAVTLGSQPEKVVFEIRELSFAPSPASLFTVPPGCGPVSGVTSATGGRAEAKVDVKVSATQELGESGAAKKAAGSKESKSSTPPARKR